MVSYHVPGGLGCTATICLVRYIGTLETKVAGAHPLPGAGRFVDVKTLNRLYNVQQHQIHPP